MQDYHNVLVWKRAMEFVKLVYRLTSHFPKEETTDSRVSCEELQSQSFQTL